MRDKKFVKTIQKWNGHATKDDKFGLYAPGRGGLEVIDLKNGKLVKVLIPKIAEGLYFKTTDRSHFSGQSPKKDEVCSLKINFILFYKKRSV